MKGGQGGFMESLGYGFGVGLLGGVVGVGLEVGLEFSWLRVGRRWA